MFIFGWRLGRKTFFGGGGGGGGGCLKVPIVIEN